MTEKENYLAAQKKWVEEHGIKVGSRVKVTRKGSPKKQYDPVAGLKRAAALYAAACETGAPEYELTEALKRAAVKYFISTIQ